MGVAIDCGAQQISFYVSHNLFNPIFASPPHFLFGFVYIWLFVLLAHLCQDVCPKLRILADK